MKQLNMRTGEIVDVKYEATATDKEDTEVSNVATSNSKLYDAVPPSEIVVVFDEYGMRTLKEEVSEKRSFSNFEPNRPSYELRRIK